MKTKLVGVSFGKRQDHIKALKPGDSLTIVKEKNEFHDKALLVTTLDGKEVGHIKRELADDIYDRVDESTPVEVLQITGGGRNTLGVNIEIKNG